MKSRHAASVAPRLGATAAILALALLGMTGCTFITPQASTIPYSASDGVNVGDEAGPLKVRNAMIIATEDGETGNFIAAVINDTAEAGTLTITVDGQEPLLVELEPDERISFGADAEPLRIDGLGVLPGADVEVFFQSGDATAIPVQIPVLDGTLPYYEDLVPEPQTTATPGPTGTPGPTETPEPTETPAE